MEGFNNSKQKMDKKRAPRNNEQLGCGTQSSKTTCLQNGLVTLGQLKK